MATTAQPFIVLDWNRFRPRRVQAVRHRVDSHPLLQLGPLLALARRLQAVGQLRQIGTDADAGTRFVASAADVDALQRIGNAKGWAVLRYVQVDPTYRTLVDAVLDSIRPQVERVDPGMYYRAGFVFASAHHTVTPFHMDVENNFILQMRGHKTLYVWEPDDMATVSEQARDRFHHDRDLIRWREEFRARAHVFELHAGEGAYMPATSPHMAETGDDLSVTMSFTYFTDATRRDAWLHNLHYLIRRAGIRPPAVGSHPVLDALSYQAVAALVGARRIARRVGGRAVDPIHAPYAAPRPLGGTPA
ncbi:MAG: cupin-like domain-containing protein [Mizugakiibacter sp.]|uniref:cupin-like domain-containing protein n=1 Tax=Mizugakiibacter sp. TaxID=1972610 RepID=UPI0031C41F58|nr:cupin-like domain-containing protein [Xanthomonadaceae bacterium]